MKPHPRIRKTVMWGGAILSGALVIAYVASAFVSIDWMGEHRGSLNVCQGMIHVTTFRRAPRANPGWLFSTLEGHDRRMVVSFECACRPAGSHLFVPLCLPLAAALLPTALAWRFDRRARRVAQGACKECGYDRTGLAAEARCPECGRDGPRLPA